MNFLNAHKIVHDYVDMVAIKQRPDEIGKRASLLKNTKDEIVDAFKLFYAHMFLFNTRTQDELKQLEVCLFSLSFFIDDDLMDEYSACYRILNDKNIIGRIKNKSAVPSAKEKQLKLMQQLASHIANHYKSEEMDTFIEKVLPLSEETRKKLTAVSSNTPKSEFWNKTFDEINSYCNDVYEIANIPMNPTDIDYFYTFSILRGFANEPKYADLFGKYKDYIFSNQ